MLCNIISHLQNIWVYSGILQSQYERKETEESRLRFEEAQKKEIHHRIKNLEQIHLNMDTAVPLGNIAAEMISNALKHAFSAGIEGKITIFLCKKENYKKYLKKSGDFRTDSKCQGIKNSQVLFAIKDNGKGFPKEIDFKNTNSLGLQIVTTLVEQINGCIELKSDHGTEFAIWFCNDRHVS